VGERSRALPDRRFRAEIALVFVAFVWGSTFVLVKEALADISTLLFLALRFTLAGAVLGVSYRNHFPGIFDRGRSSLRGGLAAGTCLFGGYVFQTFGLRLTTPSKSAFLTGMAIVLVPTLNMVIWRRRPQAAEVAGIAVAAAGLGLLTLEPGDWDIALGDLLTLGGAAFFALHVIVLGLFAPREGFERLSVFQVVTAAALALSTFWWAEPPAIRWSATVALALGVTGLFATAAAFTIQAWAQQHTSATRTALIFALEPVFAAATSYLVASEVLSARQTAGAGLILAGILLVELKPKVVAHG